MDALVDAIGKMLDKAEANLKEDIQGINKRLDILNGKVAAHEKYIISHKTIAKVLARFGGGIAVVIGLCVSAYSAFIR